MNEELKIDVYDGKITVKCDNPKTLNEVIDIIECTNLDKLIVKTKH